MRHQRLSFLTSAAALVVTTMALFGIASAASSEQTLFTFSGKDGAGPNGGLITDAAGNLYGTTYFGGEGCSHGGCGVVFELERTSNGKWEEKVLYTFKGGYDGAHPSAGLLLDKSGNLFGTTMLGGRHRAGVVFELIAKSGGAWEETVLHAFAGKDGAQPSASLISDSSGNLYGTTWIGGRYTEGTVFELTPTSGGKWKERVLHDFTGKDGARPLAGLAFDSAGNLYGTTSFSLGKAGQWGTAFELTPASDGTWREEVLHTFTTAREKDGYGPSSRLVFDVAGNLYGTTSDGGDGGGTIFELSPAGAGEWKFRVIYTFNMNKNRGSDPTGDLLFDSLGNLYGTTWAGGGDGYGSHAGGVVFELTPISEGKWREKVLYGFRITLRGRIPDGEGPDGVIFDSKGVLYGTATLGGKVGGRRGHGLVFAITP